MRGSCHLDRALNVEIGDAVKCILRHIQNLEKVK